MIYLQRPPHPALQPFIRTLWYCRAPAPSSARERVLPNGCMQILINLAHPCFTDCDDHGTPIRCQPRAIISGARARFEIIDTADLNHLVGIVLQPGGFAPMFHERADLLFQQSMDLGHLWHEPRLLEALSNSSDPAETLNRLDMLLLKLLRPKTRRSETVDLALDLFLNHAMAVADCARSIGISERRLSQVFREQVGVAPKLWCRIQRFQAATRALHRGVDMPWSDLALSCGYYDQAHFANDFKAFSSIDPTTYSSQPHHWQNHVSVL